jgi:hypothetical protein
LRVTLFSFSPTIREADNNGNNNNNTEKKYFFFAISQWPEIFSKIYIPNIFFFFSCLHGHSGCREIHQKEKKMTGASRLHQKNK